jgi:hypothetical protein
MPIPDQVSAGDSGHIQDHNDISGVLTDHQSRIEYIELDLASIPESSSIATTVYVDNAISNGLATLVDSSPAALNTLNELAAALGDDANFATTINNSLATKQPLDGDLTAISSISGTSGLLKKTAAETWTLDNTTYASQSYVNSQISGQLTSYLPLSGGILTGSITGTTATFSGNVSSSSPVQNNHVTTKSYVDSLFSLLSPPPSSSYAVAVLRATWTGVPLPSSVESANVGVITVTFPVGRFTHPPAVFTQNVDDGSASRMVYAKFIPYSVSSNSVSMQVVNNAPPASVTGGGTLSKAIVDLYAVQMSTSGAYG